MATKTACKALARKLPGLNDEIADLDRLIEPLVGELAPSLLVALIHLCGRRYHPPTREENR